MEDLICEFEKRFCEFNKCEIKFAMFSVLFSVDVGKADEQLQIELIDIQCD
jgi:hypothetical protein